MNDKKVCVIGMGYVGLTLSAVLAEKGFHVFGIERRKEVVDMLNRFEPHFHERGLEILLRKYLNKKLFITEKIPEKDHIDTFIVSVGTPLNKETKKPIMDFIIQASNEIKEYLHDGSLVILRSTVPVGTTRNVVMPILQEKTKNFHLAFCPERTIEGKALIELKYLPQVVGGMDEASAKHASELFMKVTKTILNVSSLEAAEMIKLLDNSYRDLNFAFANEIGLFCKKLGLDAVELIQAANFGYERTNLPVPGYVGGACLEKDPYILLDFTEKAGYYPRLVKQAREINENLPNTTMEAVKEKLQEAGKNIEEAKIFLSGMAFKGRPETDDLRGSPSLDVIKAFQAAGAKNLYGHDFIVKEKEIKKLGLTPCTLEEGFKHADAVVILNNHQKYEYLDIEKLLNTTKKPTVFFDSWHLYDPLHIQTIEGVIYEGLGITQK